MNKQELIAAVAAETSMPKKCVETVLKSIVDNVVAEVAKKGKVQMIHGSRPAAEMRRAFLLV